MVVDVVVDTLAQKIRIAFSCRYFRGERVEPYDMRCFCSGVLLVRIGVFVVWKYISENIIRRGIAAGCYETCGIFEMSFFPRLGYGCGVRIVRVLIRCILPVLPTVCLFHADVRFQSEKASIRATYRLRWPDDTVHRLRIGMSLCARRQNCFFHGKNSEQNQRN